MLKSLYKSIY